MSYKDIVLEETKDFDVKGAIETIKNWMVTYFKENNIKKVVIGISGGKDSTVVAKLLADVLGKNNVYGLMMPNGTQKDISDSLAVARLTGI